MLTCAELVLDLAERSSKSRGILEGWVRRQAVGKDWMQNFLERHIKIISLRCANKLERKRWEVTPAALRSTFNVLHDLKRRYPGLTSSHMLNLDETSFKPDGKVEKVPTWRGAPNAYSGAQAGRRSMSLIPVVFADGKTLPPLIIVKGDGARAPKWWGELKPELTGTCFEHARIAQQDNAYNKSTFFQLMWEKHLLPHTKALRLDKCICAHLATPLVAMFDNSSGHADPWLKEINSVE